MKKIVRELKEIILFEDDHHIIVNKPAGLSSLEDRASVWNLGRLAAAYAPGSKLCHRLDKETSGALIIAKDDDSHRHVSILLENRQVIKVYEALVSGIHTFEDFRIEAPLSRKASGDVSIDFKNGKESLTYVSTLKAFKKVTLLACRPVTGRMHQIRLHLAHAGAPIVGDVTYGGVLFYLSEIKSNYKIGRGREEQPLIRRVALHSKRIMFEDASKNMIDVEAPYPKDFRVLLKQLDRYG